MTTPRTLFAASSMICARCDGMMEITRDAIGRERKRCRSCDGIATPRPVHPDDAMLPQGLVRLDSLPLIGAHEIRCQGCAQGVPQSIRFCERCRFDRFEATGRIGCDRPCPTCGSAIDVFRGPPPKNCEACR